MTRNKFLPASNLLQAQVLVSLTLIAGCHRVPPTPADLSELTSQGVCLVQVWRSAIEVVPLDRPQVVHAIPGATPSYEHGRVSPDATYAAITLPFENRLVGITLNGDGIWEIRIDLPGFPSVSSDGKKIAISAKKALAVYDVPTGTLRELGISGDHPAWSFDSARLAYDYDGNVYVYDLAMGTASEIGRGTEPFWSSDGKSIAARTGRTTVGLINVTTHALAPLLKGEGVTVPRWSPNGLWVVYTRSGGGRWWSIGDMATEPHQIVLRNVKTGAEAVVGGFRKGNWGDYTWTTNQALCRGTP